MRIILFKLFIFRPIKMLVSINSNKNNDDSFLFNYWNYLDIICAIYGSKWPKKNSL